MESIVVCVLLPATDKPLWCESEYCGGQSKKRKREYSIVRIPPFFFASQRRFILFFHNISPSCRICRYAHCPGISKSIPAGIIHSVSFLPLWQKVAWIMDVYQGKWTKEPAGTRGYELCCSLYLFYCHIYRIQVVINRHVCTFKKLWKRYGGMGRSVGETHARFLHPPCRGKIVLNKKNEGS